MYLRKHFYLVIILLSTLVGFGCSDVEKKDQNILKKEVIAVHDEVMPHLQTLEEYKEKLHKIEEALVNGDTSNSAPVVSKIQDMTKELGRSSEAMMNWMRSYQHQLPEDMEHTAVMEYLNEEKVKINEVKDRILNSMNAADSLIKELDETED